MMTPVGRD